MCGKELSIKWVNDVYWRGKKCCGILTEAAADMESGGVDYVVVGIGLNLLEPEGGFPPELRDIAGSIFDPGEPVQRCRIAAEVANELLDMADALPETPFMEDYIQHNFVPGKDIFVIQNGEKRPAHARAITPDGHLVAVSYTHLDVYKRQHRHFLHTHCALFCAFFHAELSGHGLFAERRRAKARHVGHAAQRRVQHFV